jgi:Ca2+-binding EF-hand superfamily protein
MKIYRRLALITVLSIVSSMPVLAGQAQQRQRGMDADRDGVITRAEWRGTAESFNERDTNRDGVISGNEVRASVRTSTAAEDARRREATAIAAMDTDRDGAITRAEWRGSPEGFRVQDANRDGVLSGGEVPAAAPPVPTEETARRREATRFAGMDTDTDGVITRAEWRGGTQSFRQHDTNRDGVLSGAEVRDTDAQNPALTAEETRRREAIAERFTRADRNRDGRIAKDEWMGNAGAFSRMDRNTDGNVSREEFSDSAGEFAMATSGERRPSPAYQAGHAKGLSEGRDAGKADRGLSARGNWDLEGQRELEQADSGYEERLGPRAEYQSGYRAGFRLGYSEGFGPRRD